MIRSVLFRGFFVKNFTKTLVATIITRQAVRKRMELLEISGGSLGGPENLWMNLQGLLESHGSWPSQASACGRAALGRLTHPLVGVLSKEQWYNGSRYHKQKGYFAAAS